MASPLAQFEIKEIIPIVVSNYNISLTNSALAMIFTAAIILLFLFLGLRNLNIVPSKLQVAVELSYEFIAGMIKDNIGKEGLKYLPFVYDPIPFHSYWKSFSECCHIVLHGLVTL